MASLYGLHFLTTWWLGSNDKHTIDEEIEKRREKKRRGGEERRGKRRYVLLFVIPSLRNEAALLLPHFNGQGSYRDPKRGTLTSPQWEHVTSCCKKSMWEMV